MTVHGTCSICGGAVCTPDVWHGAVPPTPTCRSCGAVKENAHGPVIPMRRLDQPYTIPYGAPIWIDPVVWPYGHFTYRLSDNTGLPNITAEQLSDAIATVTISGAS